MAEGGRRGWPRWLAGLIGVLVVLSHVPAATAQVSPTGAAPGEAPRYYGANAHPRSHGYTYHDRQIRRLKQAGVRTVRMDVNWVDLEHSPGVFDAKALSRIDHFVRALRAEDIEPLFVVLTTPKWANGGSTDYLRPPTDPEAFATFLEILMRRYDGFTTGLDGKPIGRVRAFEIWGEPDGVWSWHQPGTIYDRAARYTALLKASYLRAKAVDPSVTILGGSISNVGKNPFPRPRQFLEGMYANGAANYMDVLSVHLYGDPPVHGIGKGIGARELIAQWQQNILPVIQAHGDFTRRIWITETGATTVFGGLSEPEQSRYFAEFYDTVAQLPYVDRVYPYEFTDGGYDGQDAEAKYGMTRADFSVKRSSVALCVRAQLAAWESPEPTAAPFCKRAFRFTDQWFGWTTLELMGAPDIRTPAAPPAMAF